MDRDHKYINQGVVKLMLVENFILKINLSWLKKWVENIFIDLDI